MATGVDRSKFRNPDMPIGYVKQEIKIVYLDGGFDVDGEHYVWAKLLHEIDIENREDYEKYQDDSFLSDSDEDISCQEKEECITVFPSDTKDKEATVIEDKEAAVIKDKEAAVIKDKEAAVIEDKEAAVIEDKEAAVIEDKEAAVIEDKEAAVIKDKEATVIEDKEAVVIKDKETTVINKPDDSVNAEKKSNHGKKDKESNLAFSLGDFLSKMQIDSEKKKISKISLKESKYGVSSPSSTSVHSRSRQRSQSRQHSPSDRHYKIVKYSPSPERCYEVQIKTQPVEQPQHLFGSYHCHVCNIIMNSELTYETHIIGKRHIKNMRMKSIPDVIAQCVPSVAIADDDSKYPKPSPGVIRKKIHTPALIQKAVDAWLSGPCPGLHLVIEIRGIVTTSYYCEICDSACSSNSLISHLNGFKHQINTVKHFKPNSYNRLKIEPKYKVERKIRNILLAVQKKMGKDKISVEVDDLASDPQDLQYHTNKPCSDSDYPCTSREISKKESDSFYAKYHQASIPDQSSADFFCKICQSHMNSLQMWEAHIRGKRHITNVKKMPGDLPSKTKTVPVNRRAVILDRIKLECPNEPVVGLKEVRETEVMETNSHSYQCFLCGSCHTSLDIIDHLISMKHRIKYLDHVNFSGREIISGMSDTMASSLVKDMCNQVQATEGPGTPAVHVNKNALYR